MLDQRFAVDLAEFDVRAAAGHVGGDHHGAELAGVFNDVAFAFGVLGLGVEHVVLDAVLAPQHLREDLGFVNAGRADQHRPAGVVDAFDLVDDRVPLVLLAHEDQVIAVDALDRPVGRDRHDVELVDLHELGGLGDGRTRHARQAFVELEEVLDRDGRKGLGLLLDLHAFFGFDRLVQAVGPLPADHEPAGEFVNDHDLAVLDDVVLVGFVDRVGADGVADQVRQVHVVADVEAADAGHLLRLGDAFVGQVRGLALGLDFVELGVLIAIGLELGQLTTDELFHFVAALLGLGFVAGVAGVSLEALDAQLALLDFTVGGVPFALLDHEVLGDLVRQVVAGRVVVGRAGDDQRRAGLVDEDRVDFVDDAEVAGLLDLLGGRELHVVAEVVEAQLGVRAVEHVALVGLGLDRRRLHVHRVDRADRQPEVVVEREDPVAVTLNEVVVDGDDVALEFLAAGDVAGQRGDDGFAFAGAHLGDLAFAQDHAADELDVERPGAERRLGLGVELADGVVERVGQVEAEVGRRRVAAHDRLGALRVGLGFDVGVDLLHVAGQLRRVEVELGVEHGADADGAVHRLAGHGHDLDQQLVFRLAVGEPLAELLGLGAELRVGEDAGAFFQRVDLRDPAVVGFDDTFVARTENFGKALADCLDDHGGPFLYRKMRAGRWAGRATHAAAVEIKNRTRTLQAESKTPARSDRQDPVIKTAARAGAG